MERAYQSNESYTSLKTLYQICLPTHLKVERLVKVGALQHRNEQRTISFPHRLALVAVARTGQ